MGDAEVLEIPAESVVTDAGCWMPSKKSIPSQSPQVVGATASAATGEDHVE